MPCVPYRIFLLSRIEMSLRTSRSTEREIGKSRPGQLAFLTTAAVDNSACTSPSLQYVGKQARAIAPYIPGCGHLLPLPATAGAKCRPAVVSVFGAGDHDSRRMAGVRRGRACHPRRLAAPLRQVPHDVLVKVDERPGHDLGGIAEQITRDSGNVAGARKSSKWHLGVG